MKKYQVEFSGLKLGSHSFDFVLDDSFFEQYDYQEINQSKIRIHADMEKEERMLVFRFFLKGQVTVLCDRCGDPLTLDLQGHQNLVVKLSDHFAEESEDIQIIRESDGFADLGQFFYEYVRLMLPAHRVHPDDAEGLSSCNPGILKKLEQLKESHAPDPRWEVLNKLKEKT